MAHATVLCTIGLQSKIRITRVVTQVTSYCWYFTSDSMLEVSANLPINPYFSSFLHLSRHNAVPTLAVAGSP